MTALLGHVENPSAKITFTTVIQTAPGQCSVCGSGQDPNGFVDTGLDFEFWGRVYFCLQCTEQIAAVFGFISPADYEDLQGERDLALLELKNSRDLIEQMRGIINGLRNISILNPIPSVPDSELIVVEQEPETIAESEQPSIFSAPATDSENAKQSGETRKPSGKPGLLNI